MLGYTFLVQMIWISAKNLDPSLLSHWCWKANPFLWCLRPFMLSTFNSGETFTILSFQQVFPNFERKNWNYRDYIMKCVSYDYAQYPTCTICCSPLILVNTGKLYFSFTCTSMFVLLSVFFFLFFLLQVHCHCILSI